MELSVLFGLLFILVVGIALGEIFGMAGSIATLLLSISTTYLHYGTEVRAYMLLILLSSLIFLGMVKKMRSWYGFMAVFAAFMLPLVHYFAIMAIPFFMFMFWVIRRDKSSWWIGLAGFTGLLTSLVYLLPQKARTLGTFLQPPTIGSFTSSLFFSLFVGEDQVSSDFPTGLYFSAYLLFIIILIGLMAFAVHMVWKRRRIKEKEKFLFLMGLTGLAPFFAILIFSFLGLSLYHHRFFLVVLWMFAAMLCVLIGRLFLRLKLVWSVLLMLLVLVVWGMMMFYYVGESHFELKRAMIETPYVDVMVGHESAFSSLPFEIWKRERGCAWRNFISTDMSEGMSNSGGFDAIRGVQDIYWNDTLPNSSFYYIRSAARFGFPFPNRTYEVKYSGEGVELLFVGEES